MSRHIGIHGARFLAVGLGIGSCSSSSPTTPVPVCTVSLAPASATLGADGGTGNVTITTAAGCAWSITGGAGWLTVTSASTGTGPATVTYTAAVNAAPDGRSAGLVIGGQTHTVSQAGRPAQACAYETSRFDVLQQSDPNTCGGATQDRCVWSAVSDVPWITITSSMPRSGDYPVLFTVAANPGTGARVGRITVRDRVVLVTPAGQ